MQKYPQPGAKEIVIKTPEALALAVNGDQVNVRWFERIGRPVPDSMRQDFEKNAADYALAKQGKWSREKITDMEAVTVPLDDDALYKRPLLLLTDRECASACEGFVQMLEPHPYMKTVGENTAGMWNFTYPELLILPKSRLNVRLSTAFFKHDDGRFVDVKGIDPVIRVPIGNDALEAALDYLRPLLKGGKKDYPIAE